MNNITQFFSQLNLNDKAVAIFEIVIILVCAALLGYLLARLVVRSRLGLLKEEIKLKRLDLAECRSAIVQKPDIEKAVITKNADTVYTDIVSTANTPDDLKIIEGIGPKIEELLNRQDIYTYAALAETSPIRIASILRTAGPRYQIHDPTSWPKQASLARQGRWQSLEDYKTKLISGRKS